MKNLQLLVAAIVAFFAPLFVLLVANQDKLYEEDLRKGTLLYFTSPG